jgi:formate C-acetyltransferase
MTKLQPVEIERFSDIDVDHVLAPGMPEYERGQRLRARVIAAENHICIERARLVTQVYKEHGGKNISVVRAEVFRRIAEEMNIYILDDELIVGHQAERHRCTPLFPEYGVQWIMDELDMFGDRPQDQFIVTPEVRREFIEEIYPFWKGKTFSDRVFSEMPEDVRLLRSVAFLYSTGLHEDGGLGHVHHDYNTLITQGLAGIKERINAIAEELDDTDPDTLDKMHFYDATISMCDSVILFAKRHSRLAVEMAKTETSPRRKKELMRIAEVCANVPEKPAANFHEALQSLWFLQVLTQVYDNAVSISPGRLDQYMYPYYVKDIERGVLNKVKAQELLEAFWVKFTEPIKVQRAADAASHAGFPMGQNLSIGGVTKDGADGTNDLSYRILEAHSHMLLMQPNFSVRVHNGSPYIFLRKVVEAIRLGNGMPQIVNDEVYIPALMNIGVELRDARDYAAVGCIECSPLNTFGRLNGGYFNLAKIFELTMSNGRCNITGEQVSIKTGEPGTFDSFEDFLDAFDRQMAYCVRNNIKWNNILDTVSREKMPVPLTSIVVGDCIANGKDVTQGGMRYNWSAPYGIGIANVTNSLMGVKQAVFVDHICTMEEMAKALEGDFEGAEPLRQYLINKTPHYGNDIAEVDLLAKFATDSFFDKLAGHKTPYGGKFVGSLVPVSSFVAFGAVTGATADGRHAKDPLADGISPSNGTDLNGPTAVLKSVTAIDHLRAPNGVIFNMRLDRGTLESDEGMERFVNLIRTYIEMRGGHIQFNVVSARTLSDAQKHPANYKGLVVRVAGYSAFFNELSHEVQDGIIGRTEHGLI